MNRSQRTFVQATFAHVSELIDGVARVAREDLSAFSKERPDLSAYESRMLLSFSADLRAAMLEALTELGIPPPVPKVSARWSTVTALTFIDVALSELRPASFRGYGALAPDVADEVNAIVAELRARVSRSLELLRGSGYEDLETRLASVPGPAGELLRGALAVARQHELVEVYPEIAAAAERATSPVADIGVFGRISTGKSSLINALVAAPVLPVGATPVTALPLRVERGEPGVVVRFASGRTETHSLDAVAQFAAESENPGNRLGVTALEIRTPTAPEGVRFLDTPGVGAYATPTTASAFAWLPRCDLGLVLIPAANAIDQEDLALLSGLRSAGVDWRMLLSKADLLSDAQLEEAVGYVRSEVARGLGGTAPDVLPISTVPGREVGLTTLGTELISPLVRERVERSRSRLRRRLGHLIAALQAALEVGPKSLLSEGVSRRRALERVARLVRDITERLPASAPDVLDRAADETARAWRHGRAAHGEVRQTLAEPANAALAAVRDALVQVAADVPGAEAVGEYATPPLFAVAGLPELPALVPPRFGRGIALRLRAKRRLAPLLASVSATYEAYARELDTWAAAVLERIAAVRGAVASERAQAPSLEALGQLLEVL